MDSTLAQYIETALWSSNDESRPDGGDPMDDNYGPEDLAPSALARLTACLESFLTQAAPILATLGDFEIDYTDIAHDLWLTQNRHGAGFWDGDWPEPQATALTDLAHSIGEINLVIGDDGMVYAE